MAIYNEANITRDILTALITECINNNETVKSCIKARRAIVTSPANEGKVGVTIIGDTKELVLPYSSAFTAETLPLNSLVSVWYNYSLNNGVVMKNNTWTN